MAKEDEVTGQVYNHVKISYDQLRLDVLLEVCKG
jgi:hypothetical protein